MAYDCDDYRTCECDWCAGYRDGIENQREKESLRAMLHGHVRIGGQLPRANKTPQQKAELLARMLDFIDSDDL